VSGAHAAIASAFAAGVLSLLLLTAALGDSTPAATGVTGAGVAVKAGVVPAPYTALVTAAGSVCAAFPAAVIAAQLQTESGFDPDAQSPAGADGIAQFEPGTWAVWGRDYDGNGTSSPFDPGDAIPAQAAYDCSLASAMTTALAGGQVSGSVTDLALAGYNAGAGAVLAAGGIPAYAETQHYVQQIDSLAAQYALPGGGTSGAPPPGPPGLPTAPAGSFAAAEVAAAEGELGLPYVWGGGTPAGPSNGGFDCSGLVLYAVSVASGGTITLPHDSNLQGRMGVQIALGLGSAINLTDLQPGDVIAFNLDGGSSYSHIGIYVGGGMLLHASHPGADGGVKLESLTEAYWQPYLWSVRRFG
jgi:cell wall-associated NlpC family hydrolase